MACGRANDSGYSGGGAGLLLGRAGALGSEAIERLRQISDQVVGLLETYRNANQIARCRRVPAIAPVAGQRRQVSRVESSRVSQSTQAGAYQSRFDSIPPRLVQSANNSQYGDRRSADGVLNEKHAGAASAA